jgi:hypothetical protein
MRQLNLAVKDAAAARRLGVTILACAKFRYAFLTPVRAVYVDCPSKPSRFETQASSAPMLRDRAFGNNDSSNDKLSRALERDGLSDRAHRIRHAPVRCEVLSRKPVSWRLSTKSLTRHNSLSVSIAREQFVQASKDLCD